MKRKGEKLIKQRRTNYYLYEREKKRRMKKVGFDGVTMHLVYLNDRKQLLTLS